VASLGFPRSRLPVTARPAGNIDYTDPVAGGAVPLADLRGRFDQRLSDHFVAREFAARRVGSRRSRVPYARISVALVEGLEAVRGALGRPVEIVEAYRYPALNRARRGAPRSQHLTGRAAVIRCAGVGPLDVASAVLDRLGPHIGLGLRRDGVHVDLRGAQSLWVEDGAPLGRPRFRLWVAEQTGGARATSLDRGARFPACVLPLAVHPGAGYEDPVTGGVVPLVKVSGNLDRPISASFRVREFASHLPGRSDRIVPFARISPEVVGKLQRLRDRLGRPITVTSAYRHPGLNRAVGGVRLSQHLTGRAADITVDGMAPTDLARQVVAVFGEQIGLGVYHRQNFVHVDIRGQKVRWFGS
jgi:uncharacterized protein YcbK (DUF882 family)